MMRLMRRMATAAVPAVVAAGALFATGGSAMAATAHTTGRGPARSGAHCTAHRSADPWVAGQIAMFDPAAAKRLAVFDPWVKDQLALFAPAAAR